MNNNEIDNFFKDFFGDNYNKNRNNNIDYHITDKHQNEDNNNNNINVIKEEKSGENEKERENYEVPFDDTLDTYKNFDINKIKTLSLFAEKGERYHVIILNDGRILTTNSSCIKVYNVDNNPLVGFKCEIEENIHVKDIIKVNDGNIIISQGNSIKVLKIGKDKIIITYEEKSENSYLYKLLDDNTIIMNKDFDYNYYLDFYYYFDEKLKYLYDRYIEEGKGRIETLCAVKENVIAFTYFGKETLGFGTKGYLKFFNILDKTKTSSIDITNSQHKLCLLNSNNLIVQCQECILLIDIKKNETIAKLKGSFNCNNNVINLNENNFLAFSWSIRQYEIRDKKNGKEIVLKGEDNMSLMTSPNIIEKYPGGKLIYVNNKLFEIKGN